MKKERTKYAWFFDQLIGKHKEFSSQNLSITQQIDELRPDKGHLANFAAWCFVAAVWVLAALPDFWVPFVANMISWIPNANVISWITIPSLLLFAYAVIVRVVTSRNELHTRRGVFGAAYGELKSDSRARVVFALFLASFATRLLAGIVLWIDSTGQPDQPSSYFHAVIPSIFTWLATLIQLAAMLAYFLASLGFFYYGVKIGLAYAQLQRHVYNIFKIFGGKLGILRSLLKITDSDLLDEKSVTISLDAIRIHPVPVSAQKYFDDIDDELVALNQFQYMKSKDSTPNDIFIVAVDEETRKNRETLVESGGLVWSVGNEESRDDEILGVHQSRSPEAPVPSRLQPTRKGILHDRFRESDLPRLQELMSKTGMTVIQAHLNVTPKVFWVQAVTPDEAAIYRDVADAMKVPSWSLWLEVTWRDNEESDNVIYPNRIDSVEVKRSPLRGTAGEREKRWWAAIEALPKASDGWTIEDRGNRGTTLRYGQGRALPDVFSTIESLPDAYAPSDWNTVPEGAGETGSAISLDLEKIPHLLVAGKPGSGKSTLLRQDMMSRLARGHRLAVFDTEKFALSLALLKAWTIMWGERIAEVATMLAYLCEEGDRVLGLIKQYGYENWYDFTPEERRELNIGPITVYYDEYETSVEKATVPSSLGKDDRQVITAQRQNVAVDQVELYMAKIAKKHRAAGIYFVVATQFPYKESLKGLRPSLGNAIQCHAPGAVPVASEIALAMGTGSTAETIELFERFSVDKDGNKGKKGLAVIRSETGALEAIRVGFAPKDQSAKIIENLGIPKASPWIINDVLGLSMRRTVDEKDLRVPAAAPFTRFTHLEDDDDFDDDDLDEAQSSSPKINAARDGWTPKLNYSE
ncbi:FtsK/SpoIIIE domain-containing protein [Subtercola vilae]|uniref:FtsK domain-containing protein n=1 Tax=Subtercola vilae TaxID=2056433 RepID=A0A4V4RD41_9MICO|nr:FtsK/SpoIIIE domain-containing protein [Subtercola vilae]TIH28784.1 hypothetical protein D4765_18270 [Subtercola vilae]